jgi:uncharacterized protein (DUF952 family)/catechol 2,3-dioxygenase-like lactoylglutathione lyase family enzyme
VKIILHIAKKSDWENARKDRSYVHPSLETARFIHCSAPEQVLSVANTLFRGMHDLVLLVLDQAAVKSDVRWENLEGGSSLFPHIYGPLNVDAVVEAHDFAPGPAGYFKMPGKAKAFLEKNGYTRNSVIGLGDFNVCIVYASDLTRSLEFYTNVLGMVKTRDMGAGVLLDAANGQFTVYLEGGKKKIQRDFSEPRVCMCFQPQEGVRAAYEALKKAGVRLVGEYLGDNPHFHMFRIADPDDLVIEFAGRP